MGGGRGQESIAQIMARLGTRSVKAAYVEMMRVRRLERRRGIVSVYRNEDVVAASHDERLRGPGAFGPSFGGRRPLIPMDLEGEPHDRYLRLLGPLFSPRSVRRSEQRTRELANELIDGFADDRVVDVMGRFCRPLGSLGFLDLFGLPRADYPFLQDFVDAVVRPTGRTVPEQAAAARAAGEEVYRYLDRVLDGDQVTGMLGDLAGGRVDGRPLAREEVQDTAYLLIIAGLEMVPTALACVFAWLAGHPDEVARLVADPGLVPDAMEELLRYETPTPSAVRLATEDVALPGGDVIRAGEQVRLVWATANLDEQAVRDPLRVDFGRRDRRHVAFGNGHHRCIGAPLSRMQLTVAVTEFHRRIPQYLTDTAQPSYFEFGIRSRLPLRLGAPAAPAGRVASGAG